MALPNRMSLRPGLLWLTLNPALIIQCLSQIYHFLILQTPPKMSLRTLRGYSYPRLKTTRLSNI
jgi:hypothetical protein